jgi:2-amino-4-hydroxy-6-hydroxymethyldihydropteridine diphosphokinase
MVSIQKGSFRMLIALGGNLPAGAGNVGDTLRGALQMLGQRGFALLALSRFFVTPAFPPGAGPDYVNACAELACDLPPQAILSVLHEVEAAFGRRRAARWGARSLDLDLLAVGDAVLPDAAREAWWRGLAPQQQAGQAPDQLILPHPRMAERAFVLIPLADIAPLWRHPTLHSTVAELLAALPEAEKAAIRPI